MLELDAVPLCNECPKHGRKNFAQWSCDNCSVRGASPSLVCSECAPPSVKPAVVFEAQSSEGAYRSYDFAHVNIKKQEDPRCKSCVFLGRGIRSGKMRAVSTWSALIHCIDVSSVFVNICIDFV